MTPPVSACACRVYLACLFGAFGFEVPKCAVFDLRFVASSSMAGVQLAAQAVHAPARVDAETFALICD